MGKGAEMTQHEMILRYIDEHGSITPMDAFRHLGITKLATRISELKKEGWEFEQELVIRKRNGKTKRYMRYSLK